MTLTEHALRGALLSAGAPSRLVTGLPWYRSMPLAAVLALDLEVDGTPVAGIRLRLDDRCVPVEALALERGSWFLQDRHALEWDAPVPVVGIAEVVLRMRLQLPNLLGPGGAGVQVLQEVRAAVPVEAAR